MPTGYTALLDDDPKLSIQKWILEGLARAFGVAIPLRDHELGLSSEEILKRLEDASDEDQYREELKKVETELRELSNVDWGERYEQEVRRVQAANESWKKSAAVTKARHDEARITLKKVLRETSDETTKAVAEFGLQQLDQVEDECKAYAQPVPDEVTYRSGKYARLASDITYYSNKLEEAAKRRRERVEAYRRLVSEVERILGKEVTVLGD